MNYRVTGGDGGPNGALNIAARRTARKMRGPAPQRHKFGSAPSSSADGRGLVRSNAANAMMNPGSQRPHWLTCSAAHACCSGCERAFDKPSIVTISAPSSAAIDTWQLSTARPSIITVQVPQSPLSQPYLVPVRLDASRSAHSKGVSLSR